MLNKENLRVTGIENSKSDWIRLFEVIDCESKKSKKLVVPRRTLDEYKSYVESKNYTILLNLKIDEDKDLITAMSIAYSWMPTMLDIHADEREINQIANKIRKLEFVEWKSSDEVDLISELSRVTNNSLVGAIKTLHLIDPLRFPLIDSRVLIAWKRLMNAAHGFLEIEPLVYSWNIGSKQENLRKLILKYFYYRSFIFDWVSKLDNGITMRDIEFRLYLMGDKN
jgi:hypothetical protein